MGTGRALRDPVSLKGEYEYEVNARSPQQDVTWLAQVTDQPGLPCRTGARVRIKIERDGTTDRKERNDSGKMGEGDRTRNLRRQAAMCTRVKGGPCHKFLFWPSPACGLATFESTKESPSHLCFVLGFEPH